VATPPFGFTFSRQNVTNVPFLLQEKFNALLASSRADFEKVCHIFILHFGVISRDFSLETVFCMFSQSKHVMQEKQETLLDTINKLKSDVDKGKEKSAQQKTQIRDLQQV